MYIKLLNYNLKHFDFNYKVGKNIGPDIDEFSNNGLHFTDNLSWVTFYNKNIKYYATVDKWDFFITKTNGNYKSNEITISELIPICDLLLLKNERLKALEQNIYILYAFKLEWITNDIIEYVVTKHYNAIEILKDVKKDICITETLVINSLSYFGTNGKYLTDTKRREYLDVIIKTFPREIFYYIISDLPENIILKCVLIDIFLLGELRAFYNFKSEFLEQLLVSHPIMYLYILKEFPDRKLELKDIFEFAIGNDKSWKILVKNKIIKEKKIKK